MGARMVFWMFLGVALLLGLSRLLAVFGGVQ
jgi:hypothetical protein